MDGSSRWSKRSRRNLFPAGNDLPQPKLRSTLLVSTRRQVALPISAVDTISLAFQHTKRQLVEPFRFGQWVRLAIVGLLAGEMGSSVSSRFPSSFKTPHHPPANEFLGPAFPKIDPALLAALIAVLVVSGI